MTPTSPHANSSNRSSTKVRIYDLSRELGRENKDILDACEELQIAAKSHSSTISASDADRIRKKFGGVPGGAKSGISSSNKLVSQPQGPSTQAATGGLQILEVRKAADPSDVGADSSKGSNTVSTEAGVKPSPIRSVTPPTRPSTPSAPQPPEPLTSPKTQVSTSKPQAPSKPPSA